MNNCKVLIQLIGVGAVEERKRGKKKIEDRAEKQQ